MTLPEASERLLDALVEAYPGYVARETGRSPDVDDLDAAIAEGTAWLRSALTELLSLPFQEQRRGPLELFQEAMRFPTEALAAAGIDPVIRDAVAAQALPGDLYDLAPASTQEISEEVWRAHLVWGAAKAAAITSSPPPEPDDDER